MKSIDIEVKFYHKWPRHHHVMCEVKEGHLIEIQCTLCPKKEAIYFSTQLYLLR